MNFQTALYRGVTSESNVCLPIGLKCPWNIQVCKKSNLSYLCQRCQSQYRFYSRFLSDYLLTGQVMTYFDGLIWTIYTVPNSFVLHWTLRDSRTAKIGPGFSNFLVLVRSEIFKIRFGLVQSGTDRLRSADPCLHNFYQLFCPNLVWVEWNILQYIQIGHVRVFRYIRINSDCRFGQV